MSSLPRFKYHPNPLKTESIIPSNETCEVCAHARGYVYCTVPYGENEIEFVCPWCIADGTANKKLGAQFSDSHPLAQAGISQEIIDEVTLRTPGYISWQQECWMYCCDDACEFHGDAPAKELRSLDDGGLKKLSESTDIPIDHLPEIIKYYQPKGSPAFYKFVCRHCNSIMFNYDCD